MVFYKKAVLKNIAKFPGKQLCWSLFLIKLQAFSPVALLKEIPTQVFFCAYCELLKNIYFEKHLRTAALPFNLVIYLFSAVFLNRDFNRSCLVDMFSLHFPGSKFLINLRRQFRVRKIFPCTYFFLYTSFCVICSLFILCLKLLFRKYTHGHII